MIYALAGINILQWVGFTWLIHKLTDKLMARNYYDMKMGDAQAKSLFTPKVKAVKPAALDEDLGALTEIW